MGLFGKSTAGRRLRPCPGRARQQLRPQVHRPCPALRPGHPAAGRNPAHGLLRGFTGTHTLVVTDQRLLVIRNSFGGGRPKELWLAAKPEEIRSIRHGGNGNAYGILIQVGSTTVATQASDHLSGRVLAESVQELCGMD